MILYKHPFRLTTRDGSRYTNARCIGKDEEGNVIVLTDCFNILKMKESDVLLHWNLGKEYLEDPDNIFPVTIEDFIESVEDNIRELRVWIKEHSSDTDVLL